jgi:precorrin-2/cobalt-factor-2 C20-methyltransferase
LIGVGVGPSDPDLVTERALQVLRGADRVFAPCTGPDAIGRAEAIVRAAAPEVVVERLVVAIGEGEDGYHRSLGTVADQVVAALDRGAVVAITTLGDPNVYSAFPALAARVRAARPAVPVASVPGIMAFQELAARTGTVLAEGDEQLALLTLGGTAGRLDDALDDPSRTVVVYRGGRHLPEVARGLDRRGRLDGAVVGEMLGLPGGRSVPIAEVAAQPASYLATMIVPAARPGAAPGGGR